MNCYRFQIAWSRVCPQGTASLTKRNRLYDRFINDLIARGIEPMIASTTLICRWRWRRSTTVLTIAA
jgi:beta-glucosidase/6-phospho-beta-glucosidase/beta-galactosidase